MDDNVDISKELQETRELFDSILITQSQHSAGSSGKKVEETLNEIATDILSKVWGVWGVWGVWWLEHSDERYMVLRVQE